MRLVGEPVAPHVVRDRAVALVEQPVEDARADPVDVHVADEAVEEEHRGAVALVVVVQRDAVVRVERRHGQTRVPETRPPASTTSVVPETRAPPGPARYTAAAAMSSGCARRALPASPSCSHKRAGEVGLDQARRDAVDGHAGRELVRQDLGQVDRAGLRDVVRADRTGGIDAADRRDEDHPSTVLGHPRPPRELRPHEHAAQVHAERLVPRAEVGVDGGAVVRVGRRVRDQHVERAEPLDGGLDARGRLVLLARVGGERGESGVRGGGQDLLGRLVEPVLAAGREHHRRALGGIHRRDRLADPLRRPRDERDLPCELRSHGRSLARAERSVAEVVVVSCGACATMG